MTAFAAEAATDFTADPAAADAAPAMAGIAALAALALAEANICMTIVDSCVCGCAREAYTEITVPI